MASQVGLSNSLFVTGTFALPFGLYYTYLQARVIQQRIRNQASVSTTSPGNPEFDPLLASCRALGNFQENVPFALLLAGIVEANGGDRTVLAGALSVLFAARIAHAEFGVTGPRYQGKGRAPGFFGTALVMNGLAIYSAWLVKGYWGL